MVLITADIYQPHRPEIVDVRLGKKNDWKIIDDVLVGKHLVGFVVELEIDGVIVGEEVLATVITYDGDWSDDADDVSVKQSKESELWQDQLDEARGAFGYQPTPIENEILAVLDDISPPRASVQYIG